MIPKLRSIKKEDRPHSLIIIQVINISLTETLHEDVKTSILEFTSNFTPS